MQCIHVSHAFSNVGIKKLKEKNLQVQNSVLKALSWDF